MQGGDSIAALMQRSIHRRKSTDVIGRADVTWVLLPELRPGNVVVMDNLSSQKRAAVRERIVSGLRDLIGRPVNIFEPDECANYFKSCGSDPE